MPIWSPSSGRTTGSRMEIAGKSCGLPLENSSGDFWSMFSPMDSIAFATMACSPVANANPTSQISERCWMPRQRLRRNRINQKPMNLNRSYCANHAQTVVAPCTLSRCFAEDKNLRREHRQWKKKLHDKTPLHSVRHAFAMFIIAGACSGASWIWKSHQPGNGFPRQSAKMPQNNQPKQWWYLPTRNQTNETASRGFHLGRFSNAGQFKTSCRHKHQARIKKPSPERTFASYFWMTACGISILAIITSNNASSMTLLVEIWFNLPESCPVRIPEGQYFPHLPIFHQSTQWALCKMDLLMKIPTWDTGFPEANYSSKILNRLLRV